MTDPSIPSSKSHEFEGKVDWQGVTCNTTYEATGGGPFLHRRILFKSTVPWPANKLLMWSGLAAQSGLSPGEYIRGPVSDLKDQVLVGCLRRLFAQSTVRGVVQGPTSTLGVTVLRDEVFQLTGSDDGLRRRKKYWNDLKREPVMEYTLEPSGVFSRALVVGSKAQHIYLVDVFSYGLEGLDVGLPLHAPVPPSEQARQETPLRKTAKRVKSDHSGDSNMSNSDGYDMADVRESLPVNAGPTWTPAKEDDDSHVRVFTEMKLYFRLRK